MPRLRRRQAGSIANKKKRKTRIFSLASHARFAYKDCTEAIKPGNEEITR
jgi:hypothetical protein